MKLPFNKFIYIGFIFLGIYFATFKKDFINASMYFGIALAFDPFDVEQTWGNRPKWQKGVLIIHLIFAALLLGLGIGLDDN